MYILLPLHFRLRCFVPPPQSFYQDFLTFGEASFWASVGRLSFFSAGKSVDSLLNLNLEQKLHSWGETASHSLVVQVVHYQLSLPKIAAVALISLVINEYQDKFTSKIL